MVLEFLLRNHARTGDAEALRMAARQRSRRWRAAGIYDQLAGGFARYSVDAGWVVPHFEKMLYDNALLLRVYLHHWRATGADWARRVADETAAFLVRDLGTPEGGFASALDADTDGVEGLTYVWTPDQLVEVLGPDDGRWAAGQFEVTDRGTFEHGALDVAATVRTGRRRPGSTAVRERLLAARAQRPAAGAGRQGGHRLERPGDRRARRARGADRHGRPRSPPPAGPPSCWPAPMGATAGCAGRPGTASPAATRGCSRTTATSPRDYWHCTRRPAEGRWLDLAGELLDVVAEQFIDDSDGAGTTPPPTPRRWSTGPSTRPTGPTPAGIAAAAGAAVTYAALAGSPRHRELGEAALSPRWPGW